MRTRNAKLACVVVLPAELCQDNLQAQKATIAAFLADIVPVVAGRTPLENCVEPVPIAQPSTPLPNQPFFWASSSGFLVQVLNLRGV